MKKLLVVLLMLAGAGVPAYMWVKGSIYGVSEEHPLGQFDLLDDRLTEREFEKKSVDIGAKVRSRFDSDLEGAEMFAYRHEYADRMDTRNSSVSIIRDGVGKVRGVGGSFWSGREDMRDPGSRGEALIGTLWLETAGKKPEFRDDQAGRGRFATQLRIAEFARNGVQGRWVKSYATNMDARSISDRVTFYVE